MKDKAKETLKVLISAIENIDHGCSVCIRAFIEDANRNLEKNDILYKFVYDGDEVRIEKV